MNKNNSGRRKHVQRTNVKLAYKRGSMCMFTSDEYPKLLEQRQMFKKRAIHATKGC